MYLFMSACMNKYVKSLGLISLPMIVLACGGDLDQLRGEIGDLKRAGIEVLNDIRELKSNNKKLGEISISLALREPVLFEKIFKIDGNSLLYNVDFKQNAQCKLSFDSFGKIKLETSFKNNDFDIKNTDRSVARYAGAVSECTYYRSPFSWHEGSSAETGSNKQ